MMRHSVHIIDAGFCFIGAAGVFTIMKEPANKAATINWAAPWTELGFALLLTLFVSSWAVFGSKLDRRCAEDYLFQIISSAAIIAVVTTIMSHAIWDLSILNEHGLPKPTSGDMLGIMLFSWAMAYGFYRLRGVNA